MSRQYKHDSRKSICEALENRGLKFQTANVKIAEYYGRVGQVATSVDIFGEYLHGS